MTISEHIHLEIHFFDVCFAPHTLEWLYGSKVESSSSSMIRLKTYPDVGRVERFLRLKSDYAIITPAQFIHSLIFECHYKDFINDLWFGFQNNLKY